jgi:Tol biopolymer transport system component
MKVRQSLFYALSFVPIISGAVMNSPRLSPGISNVSYEWSPDGSRIAFSTYVEHIARNSTSMDVHLVNADGSALRNITESLPTGLYFNPTWSPDGTQLAFESPLHVEGDMRGHNLSLFIVQPDGAAAPTSIDVPIYSVNPPVWSPDGAHIAFLAIADVGYGDDLVIVDIPSGIVHPVVPSGEFVEWSSDGSRMIVSLDMNLWIMNIDGTNRVSLTDAAGWYEFESWSPDETQILFRSRPSREFNSAPNDLWIVNADGSGLLNLTQSESSVYSNGWSPDGSKIIVWTRHDQSAYCFLVSTAGGSPRSLVGEPRCSSGALWSPDGAHIALSNQDGIYVTDANGDHRQRLVENGGMIAWSPDGTQIAYYTYSEAEGRSVSVMEADGSNRRSLRTFPDREYDNIVASSWSPDSAALAFQWYHGDLETVLVPSPIMPN